MSTPFTVAELDFLIRITIDAYSRAHSTRISSEHTGNTTKAAQAGQETDFIDRIKDKLKVLHSGGSTPIPVIIHCPKCHLQHVDRDKWATEPHKSHLCNNCGTIWRVADVPTVGVEALPPRPGDLGKVASGPLTDNDWIQLQMAAQGCTSGIGNWPWLRAAIQKVVQYKPLIEGKQTTLDPSCETVVCPDCRGKSTGVIPCRCSGTGLVLKNPPMHPSVFNAIVDKVVDRLCPDLDSDH